MPRARGYKPQGAISRMASVGGLRLAGGAEQPIGLDQDMALVRLRPQEEADDDEDGAEQEANDYHASIGLAVDGVKRRDHEYEAFFEPPTPSAAQDRRNADRVLT